MVKTHKKWGVQIVAFNEVDFLEATIRMFQPFVDKIVVSTGNKSWKNNIENDGSVWKVVKPLVEEFNNVNLVKGDWKTEEEQRNNAMYHLDECDYTFIVDADELWSSGDITRTKEHIESMPGYNVFRGIWNTRFKNINWRVDPREPYRPIIIVKKGTKFFENREVKAIPETAGLLIPERVACVEHFSYLRSSDYKIKEKISTFSHANEIVGGIDMWYENVYLQADLDSKDLHPTHPYAYAGLTEEKIDPEIIKFLKKYSPQLFKK